MNHPILVYRQVRTDNSWGPRAIGDHGAPVSSPTIKPHPKKPMKGTRGISWGPLLTPGTQAVPEWSVHPSTVKSHTHTHTHFFSSTHYPVSPPNTPQSNTLTIQIVY
ncbi:unnamed protein product [Staurois parvus]|uniref:Uncharacterized protein n=1 Tax=Staurois parvus TaxID=386267 RepID=A0ABN9E278_9NEOB|nr:unnamed protein product [Staurois parvus]